MCLAANFGRVTVPLMVMRKILLLTVRLTKFRRRRRRFSDFIFVKTRRNPTVMVVRRWHSRHPSLVQVRELDRFSWGSPFPVCPQMAGQTLFRWKVRLTRRWFSSIQLFRWYRVVPGVSQWNLPVCRVLFALTRRWRQRSVPTPKTIR